MQPRGIRNFNPGNIRISASAWQGKKYPNTDGSFEQFETMEHGIRALMVIVRTYMKRHKLTTIKQIINRWAPPVENNTDAYIATVVKRTGIEANTKLRFDKTDISRLVEAICFVECGGSYITNEQIDKAWGLL